MTAQLSKEQSAALQAHPDDRLRVVDPETNRIYYLVEAATLTHLEQSSAHEAIARGIADMEAGRTTPIEEVHAELRQELRTRHGQ